MRQSNVCSPVQNQACLLITSRLYDRRGESYVCSIITSIIIPTQPLTSHSNSQGSTAPRLFLSSTHSHTLSISPRRPRRSEKSSLAMAASNASSASSVTSAQIRLRLRILLSSTASCHRGMARTRRLRSFQAARWTAKQPSASPLPSSPSSTSALEAQKQ